MFIKTSLPVYAKSVHGSVGSVPVYAKSIHGSVHSKSVHAHVGSISGVYPKGDTYNNEAIKIIRREFFGIDKHGWALTNRVDTELKEWNEKHQSLLKRWGYSHRYSNVNSSEGQMRASFAGVDVRDHFEELGQYDMSDKLRERYNMVMEKILYKQTLITDYFSY